MRYLNLPIEELKKAAIAQMKDGQPVWFGCDVGKHSERDSGIMDLDIRGLEDLLDTRFTMTKAERLDYGQSLMTHAMVFQGVNLDENGKPNRWRVENSWDRQVQCAENGRKPEQPGGRSSDRLRPEKRAYGRCGGDGCEHARGDGPDCRCGEANFCSDHKHRCLSY